MDLKIVIRQMLDKGLTREQVVSNLKELGVNDAEKLFDEAAAGRQAPQPSQPQQAPAQRLPPKISEEDYSAAGKGLFKNLNEPQEEKSEEKEKPELKRDTDEISISDLVQSGARGKSLFGGGKESEEPQAEEEPSKESWQDELAGGKAGAGEEAKNPLSLEEKVDETIALLKALQSINQKILETDRKLLLRLK